MEYVSLGDLEKNVIANSGRIPESETRSIAEQILSGLRIMHAESFAHRDRKPQNVLVVNGPPLWWVKLADFGLSKRLTDTTAFYTKNGTQSYMAPEILNYLNAEDSHDHYTNSVDIWALGCIIYRLITGTVPFPPGKSLMKYCDDKSLFPYDALFDSGITSECSKFLRQLLTTQPTDRPPASQALQHLWILSGEQ
ncbi:kinase-like domain-containing protein [Rhexocercosporidium sp. MPI-PUGE-AT-0058]|nr:kinase-like domain-containing protein [Rhexocercosporidium sp. MPI-PUGE-AT-0058]